MLRQAATLSQMYSRRVRVGAFLGVMSALVGFVVVGVIMLRFLFDGWGP
jgi:hypothetical protein